MNIWGKLLQLFGWEVQITVPIVDKCVICVAPHTSNWDFILGIFAYYSVGRRANFLMKEGWFFFPLKYLFRSLGGIPVPRVKGSNLTDHIIADFGKRDYMNLAVTPEGTRSRQPEWRKGFLYIAKGAKVPLYLGILDYKHKKIIIKDSFRPEGDILDDLQYVKDYYKDAGPLARYPEKFTV